MNNQLSPVMWQTVFKKSLLWGVWLFLLVNLQTTVFALHPLWGAIPDLVVPAVCAIALLDGERAGTIAGITGGFLLDALGGVGLSLSPLFYMMVGVITALLADSFLRGEFSSWLFVTAGMLILTGGLLLIPLYTTVNAAHFSFSDVWSRFLVPRFFASLVAGLPVYFLTRKIWDVFLHNREMES